MMIKSIINYFVYLCFLPIAFSGCLSAENNNLKRVLVFSKTEGYRHHESIEAGRAALAKLADDAGLLLDTTENASLFNDDSLSNYQAVVLLNISGAVFNEEQRLSFKRFVQAGGGVLAIHASADAERNWDWYGNLVGAYFDSHPPTQKLNYVTVDKTHAATVFMPDSLTRTEEVYNFRVVNPAIRILIQADEHSYSGGTMGEDHPAVWYHEFDGGRSFYTSWGHLKQSWEEPLFLKQISAALKWVMGGDAPVPLDYSKSVPEESRFIRHELMTGMDEPMQMAILKNGNVFVAQRRGGIVLYEAKTNSSRIIGTIPVLSAYEDGLLGIAADPNFEKNRFLYVFYAEAAPQDSTSDYRISRFTLTGENMLIHESERVMIRIPHQSADGIHTGGALLFDPRGTGDLFITVGDNTSPRATLYAPLDERPGREVFNAQRTSANTNDLRGKILRIHPEPDGSYTIPKGNLFPEGTAQTRPEIYSMGHRQPWRLSMDPKNGWLYLGEVGPDAPTDSANRGPMAYDEFNQIREPGNFGWPYFGGNNRPYYETDFQTGVTGDPFDKDKPINSSRLNTGLKDLPPAQGAFIWYSNETSKEFSIMGQGARTAVGGPIFRKANYTSSSAFPEYYDGKWFITEWIRDWITVVTMDTEGRYKSMEKFLPNMHVAGPMDLQFGPDGHLYILEYGKGWFTQNNDSRLSRVEYNPGNRKPVAVAAADRVTGAIPFEVNFSSAGSLDYDKDSLSYQWTIESENGYRMTSDQPHPKISFEKTGVYTVRLTVADAQETSESQTLTITAGNSAPEVKLEILKGNRSFFFLDEIEYRVSVTDREDGSLNDGRIHDSSVQVSMGYAADGFKPMMIGETTPEQRWIRMTGGMIINSNDCYHCHAINSKSIGPTFIEIAEKYKSDKDAEESLAEKVINGSRGVWGSASMSAHPDLPLDDAKRMVRFILNLAHPPPASLPVKGKHNITLPTRFSRNGVYVLRACYQDKGAHGLPRATSEDAIVLTPPWMLPSTADRRFGGMNVKIPNPRGEVEILQGQGAYISYSAIDLTGIRSIELNGEGNGQLEIRLDAASGEIIGSTENVISTKRDGNETNNTLQIPLKQKTGFHDVFFVVKGKSYSIKNYIIFQK